MSATTIRLSEELKVRVANAAERTGTTFHKFIRQAIEEKLAAEALDVGLLALADERFEQFSNTGMAIPWPEMREYLLQRAKGESASLPSPKKVDSWPV